MQGSLLSKQEKVQHTENEGVILTLNGQTHSADIKTGFFANKKVGLGSRIAKDLLVVIDCSALDANERDELFMTSRDSVAEDSDIFKELKKVLRKALHGHEGLRELKNKRLQEEIDEQLKDDKPSLDIYKKVLKTNPTLEKYFGIGDRLPSSFKPNKVKKRVIPLLHDHPSFFHFWGKDEGVELKRLAHIDQQCRISFTTDAKRLFH